MSHNLLRNQSYHWFWGLRMYAKPQPLNFLIRIEKWSMEDVKKLTDKQSKIRKSPLFKRFFYWFLNLDYYAEDYYLLKAYEFKESDKMKKWFKVPSIKDKILNYVESIKVKLSSQEETNNFESANATATSEERFAKKDKLANPNEDPILTRLLNVTALNSDDFKTLGIECVENDSIMYIKVRTAYKEQALLLHPDRNKEADAETKFKELQNAYERLNQAYELHATPGTPDDLDQYANLLSRLSDIEMQSEAAIIRLGEIDAQIEKNEIQIDAYLSGLKVSQEEQKARDVKLDELQDKITELKKQIEKLVGAVKKNRESQDDERVDVPLEPDSELTTTIMHSPLITRGLFAQTHEPLTKDPVLTSTHQAD